MLRNKGSFKTLTKKVQALHENAATIEEHINKLRSDTRFTNKIAEKLALLLLGYNNIATELHDPFSACFWFFEAAETLATYQRILLEIKQESKNQMKDPKENKDHTSQLKTLSEEHVDSWISNTYYSISQMVPHLPSQSMSGQKIITKYYNLTEEEVKQLANHSLSTLKDLIGRERAKAIEQKSYLPVIKTANTSLIIAKAFIHYIDPTTLANFCASMYLQIADAEKQQYGTFNRELYTKVAEMTEASSFRLIAQKKLDAAGNQAASSTTTSSPSEKYATQQAIADKKSATLTTAFLSLSTQAEPTHSHPKGKRKKHKKTKQQQTTDDKVIPSSTLSHSTPMADVFLEENQSALTEVLAKQFEAESDLPLSEEPVNNSSLSSPTIIANTNSKNIASSTINTQKVPPAPIDEKKPSHSPARENRSSVNNSSNSSASSRPNTMTSSYSAILTRSKPNQNSSGKTPISTLYSNSAPQKNVTKLETKAPVAVTQQDNKNEKNVIKPIGSKLNFAQAVLKAGSKEKAAVLTQTNPIVETKALAAASKQENKPITKAEETTAVKEPVLSQPKESVETNSADNQIIEKKSIPTPVQSDGFSNSFQYKKFKNGEDNSYYQQMRVMFNSYAFEIPFEVEILKSFISNIIKHTSEFDSIVKSQSQYISSDAVTHHAFNMIKQFIALNSTLQAQNENQLHQIFYIGLDLALAQLEHTHSFPAIDDTFLETWTNMFKLKTGQSIAPQQNNVAPILDQSEWFKFMDSYTGIHYQVHMSNLVNVIPAPGSNNATPVAEGYEIVHVDPQTGMQYQAHTSHFIQIDSFGLPHPHQNGLIHANTHATSLSSSQTSSSSMAHNPQPQHTFSPALFAAAQPENQSKMNKKNPKKSDPSLSSSNQRQRR